MVEARPIGYVEVQRSWVGRQSGSYVDNVIGEARETAARGYPGYAQHGARIETVTDGAGVDHHTLYMGFAPRVQTTPPLNPRNLNDADHPTIGNPVGDFFIGQKESKF